MWESQASIGTPRDYVIISGLTLITPLMRWILHTCVFEPLAKAWTLPPHQRNLALLPEKRTLKLRKIEESLWKILMYSGMFGIGVVATYNERWARDSRELWQGWPYQDLNSAVRVLYCVEMAFCAASVAMLLLWETRRHDFGVMMLHHLVTIALITASYYYNFLRVGCLVMMLHDVNDVIMEAAKIAKYCGHETLSTALFIGFVLSWAATRLTYFPWVIIWSVVVESPIVLGYRLPGYVAFNTLLCTLLLIHCYWFRLILNVIWRKVKLGDMQDVREDEED